MCARRYSLIPRLALAAALAGGATDAWARKTNQPIYEDPYDIAAGGASLTRASKDGMIFSNPALLPQGGKLIRWIGTTFTLLSNKESVDTAKELAQSAGKKSSSSTDSAQQQQQSQAFVDKVFKAPVRVGEAQTISFITSNFALAEFTRFEPDIHAKKYGAAGVPEIEAQAEAYGGVAVGTGIKTPFRWLSFGLTGKYLEASEPDESLSITDQAGAKAITSKLQADAKPNHGQGVDAGTLLFFQGSAIDLSMAGKVDDVGGTKLSGPADSPKMFKQVVSGGLGLTLHTGADAIHMAADYRDILGAYGEPKFKRFYAGTKVMLHTYVGVAAGYYNGYPSMGAEIDLIFLRLGFTSFTRELGDHPGVDPRHMYMASLSMGI